MANKNHKLLRDNTDHQSVNQSAGSITLISERQAPEHPSVLMAYSISQHTGVYNPFQITLFTKTTAFFKKKKEKVTGNEAINACVPRRVPRLTTNGLRPSTKPAFIERFTCKASKYCHKGGFETLVDWRHRGFFVVLCM